MVILKKVKGATLVETLTASVLIIIVFMIASLSFNNIFINHQKRDRSSIQNYLKELEYKCLHELIKLPYREEYNQWDIYIEAKNNMFILTAEQKEQKLIKRLHK